MNEQRPSSDNFMQFRNGSGNFSGAGGTAIIRGTEQAPGSGNVPPPIPPRIMRPVQNYRPYGQYGLGYGLNDTSGYGYGNNWNYRSPTIGGGYGAYGSYGGMGGYSNMYPGGFQSLNYGNQQQMGGPSGDAEDRFIQFAEESSRPAFQSIESIVRTFTSVAMMLESTYLAITSSFRAILSVAENVGRTRNMFGDLLSTFALVRLSKWLFRKITFMLGLNPDDPSTEKIWRKTALEAINGENRGRPSTWPILIFLSLTIAIPYIINKLVNNVRQSRINGKDPREWLRSNEPVYSALVLYDFEAASPEELSVKSGEKVWLAPQSLRQKNLPGWSQVTNSRGGIGNVPTNYTMIVGELKKKGGNNMNDNAKNNENVQQTSHQHSIEADEHLFSTEEAAASKEHNQKLSHEISNLPP